MGRVPQVARVMSVAATDGVIRNQLPDDTLLVFLSDTHIGGAASSDIFESAAELTLLLEDLNRHNGPVELVLAGDFLDVLRMEGASSHLMAEKVERAGLSRTGTNPSSLPRPAGCRRVACPARTLRRYWRSEQGILSSWRPESNRGLLFTRQERIVQGVLACAVLAAQVGWVVQPVRSCRAW
jgi:hypothetical protein